MKNRIKQLKVKRKSLAAEAKIIRQEESRARAAGDRELRLDLVAHRKRIVRPVARSSHLAHGALKGMPYAKMEPKLARGADRPDFAEIKALVQRFGVVWEASSILPYRSEPREEYEARKRLQEGRFEEWLEAAKEHLRKQR